MDHDGPAVWQGDPQGRTRALWEEVFSQDSKQFLDYYYQYKAPEARVYVILEGQNIISMLHLNPYRVSCHGEEKKSYYIVGVATKKEYRHRGYMRRLLCSAIADSKQEGCPFLFLMPANPAIYEPFGFRYGYRHLTYQPSALLPKKRIMEAMEWGRSDRIMAGDQALVLEVYRNQSENGLSVNADDLTAFADHELRWRFHVFCVHDRAYFDRLQKELRSENGDLFLIYRQEETRRRLTGYFCYSDEEEPFYQEVILTQEAQKLFLPGEEKNAIMFLDLHGWETEERCYFPELV